MDDKSDMDDRAERSDRASECSYCSELKMGLLTHSLTDQAKLKRC